MINIDYILNTTLQEKIDNNPLYREAFTHSSYANENKLDYSYERLEFLGDSILSSHISIFIFHRFQEKDEGQLTSLRSKAVRQETLSAASLALGLQNYLFLGNGEKGVGTYRDSILSDIFESFLAAVFLDLGHEAVDKILRMTLFEWLVSNQLEMIVDYKTKLQEYVQSEKYDPITYKVMNQAKENHAIHFTVGVYLDNNKLLGKGTGTTKKKAEQEAAKDALEKFSAPVPTLKPVVEKVEKV